MKKKKVKNLAINKYSTLPVSIFKIQTSISDDEIWLLQTRYPDRPSTSWIVAKIREIYYRPKTYTEYESKITYRRKYKTIMERHNLFCSIFKLITLNVV